MGLKEYKTGSTFNGTIGITVDQSSPAWPQPQRAKKNAPNVLFIVLDDTGFAQLGCYGSPIRTPNLDQLAKNGLLYNNMHTTALCSPTRACILTGRNHHSNHVAAIMELSSGYPGYDCYIPFQNGFLSEILQQHGYNTYCIGKWHLTPSEQTSAAGPYDRWPLGRGFERYYGFLGGDTSQYYPDLVYDNHQVEPPKSPKAGYHLTEDLVDKAIEFIADSKQVAPDKPFFMYFATGAMHAPHQVPQSWADKYKHKFDQGWSVYREKALKKQKAKGVLPPNTELSRHDPDVQNWSKLSHKERKLYARMMEIFAGFLEHTDEHIGRLIKFLKKIEALDNTLIMIISDNGSSSEGGTTGSVNENKFFNKVPESLDENLKALHKLGGPEFFNHFPWGWSWAGNTPFRRWKKETYRGGVSDPFIIHWPAGIKTPGQIRSQYTHVIDMVPTVLELLKIQPPTEIKGATQSAFEGKSFAHTLNNAKAKTNHMTQYFEMFGHRAIYHKGWRAVCPYPGPSYKEGVALGYHFGDMLTAKQLMERDQNGWELYRVTDDLTESHNLASKYPERLQQLIHLWYIEAGKYNVLPLDGPNVERFATPRPQISPDRKRYIYYPSTQAVPENAAVKTLNRSYIIVAIIEQKKQGSEGVLLAHGGNTGGYVLFVKDNKLHYVYNYVGSKTFHLVSKKRIPLGKSILSYEFTAKGKPDFNHGKGVAGTGKLYINDALVAQMAIPYTIPVTMSLSDGLTCGYDKGSTVSKEYKAPFAFTGIIEKVIVDVSGKSIKDYKANMKIAFARQ